MRSERDEIVAALEEMTGAPPNPNEQIIPAGQRPCPICGQHMHVEDVVGIPVDTCSQHGIWLDVGELPLLVSKLRQDESVKRLQATLKAYREGQRAPVMLRGWSLLFDE